MKIKLADPTFPSSPYCCYALAVDTAFKDDNGKPGFDMANRKWPHGWTGTGKPHGVVFSR
ncbi:MAG: hypothetical protein ABI821_17455 [Pseudomonadota bacterium]